jgi:hypothetical protein
VISSQELVSIGFDQKIGGFTFANKGYMDMSSEKIRTESANSAFIETEIC